MTTMTMMRLGKAVEALERVGLMQEADAILRAQDDAEVALALQRAKGRVGVRDISAERPWTGWVAATADEQLATGVIEDALDSLPRISAATMARALFTANSKRVGR